MNFLQKQASIVGLTIIVAGLIVTKLPDLHLPYFWDELCVYGQGILVLKDSGHLTLLPGHIDPDISRGHPLLCFLLYAGALSFCGGSITVAHACSLVAAAGTLVALYLVIRSVFGWRTALLCSFLLAIQPLFFAMSGILSPEMMLAFCSILAIGAFVHQRWWVYLFFSTCGILLKESGIALPAAAILFILVEAIRARQPVSLRTLRHLVLAALPLSAFFLFLAAQKQHYGWYIYPFHTSILRLDFFNLQRRAIGIGHALFAGQGRAGLSILACAGIITFFPRIDLPDAQRRMLLMVILFLLMGIGFAATFQYLVRYLLYLLPFCLLLISVAVIRIAALLPARNAGFLYALFSVFALSTAIFHLSPKKFADTADMSYRYFVQTQKQCINWCERQPWRDSTVASNFPVYTSLQDARYGFLATRKSWPAINQLPDSPMHTTYAIYYWQDGLLNLPDPTYQEIKRFQCNDAIFSVIRNGKNNLNLTK